MSPSSNFCDFEPGAESEDLHCNSKVLSFPPGDQSPLSTLAAPGRGEANQQSTIAELSAPYTDKH